MNLHVRIVTPTGNFHSHVGDCDENSRVLILSPEQAEWLRELIDPEISNLEEMIKDEGNITVFSTPLKWAQNITKQITDYEE